MLDIGLYVFYALLAIAIIAAIAFPIVNSLKTPKALLRSVAGVGAILVLFGIAYAVSSSEVTPSGRLITPGGAKLISAGLITFYITLILAILAVAYSEISKALK